MPRRKRGNPQIGKRALADHNRPVQGHANPKQGCGDNRIEYEVQYAATSVGTDDEGGSIERSGY